MFTGPWSREAIKVLVSAGDVKVVLLLLMVGCDMQQ